MGINASKKNKIINNTWTGAYYMIKINREYVKIPITIDINENILRVERDNIFISFELQNLNPPQVYSNHVLIFDNEKRAVSFHVEDIDKFLNWLHNFVNFNLNKLEWTYNKLYF